MAPPRQPPELNDDAVSEILLRLPPDEPADLLRASLVCKLWLRIVFNTAFLRDYRAFHRDAPLLGFFYNLKTDSHPRFVSTSNTAASPLPPAFEDRCTSRVLDCRHGRVLLRKKGSRNFIVWDPITGDWDEIQRPGVRYLFYSAVVLCAVAGCDHHDCHGGPFLVVCVGNATQESTLHACVYSSEARAWGTPVVSDDLDGGAPHMSDDDDLDDLDEGYDFNKKRAAVIGDGMYCTYESLMYCTLLLKYDLVERCFSPIKVPSVCRDDPVLMQNEDGSLGFAGVRGTQLELWSATMADLEEEEAAWVKWRVVEIEKISPIGKLCTEAEVLGFAEHVGIFFVSTDVGDFTFELKSGRVRKVINGPRDSCAVFPFNSFFTPDFSRSKLLSLMEMN